MGIGSVELIIIVVCAFMLWRLVSKLEWTNGSTICISLAALYYFVGRHIVFAMQSTSVPGNSLGPLDGTLPCFLLGMLAIYLKWSRQHDSQAFLDRKALSRIESAKQGVVKAFCLYLRSFEITNSLPVEDPDATTKLSAETELFSGKGLTEVDFETVLARALESIAPFVALGRPGEAFGATRIPVTDEAWQEEAAFLMDNAHVIFLVPSLRPGTLWEIKRIVSSRYLRKTVFILPPGFPGRKWVDICECLKQPDFGIHLPCPDEAQWVSWGPLKHLSIGVNGCLFMVNDQGLKTQAIPIRPTAAGLAHAITELVNSPNWPPRIEPDEQMKPDSQPAVTAPIAVVQCPHCHVTVATSGGIYPCCRRSIDAA